jgi:shikimate dehydrogenase
MIDIRGTTRLVGLLGWPTSHSLSPPMQNAGFAALGLDWAYVPLPTPPELLTDAIRGLVAMGFAGANVTIPHKEAVIPLCDTLDTVAERAASVNTLLIQDGLIHGVSTDGAAATDQVDAGGRQALVLGTGGAAKAVIDALRAVGCEVRVASRHDPEWPPSTDGVELLVNCTPVKEELIVAPSAEMQVVDLAYLTDGRDTALVAAAKAAGCKVVVDGLEVLVAQGAASFTLWTGQVAPLDAMRAAVRSP